VLLLVGIFVSILSLQHLFEGTPNWLLFCQLLLYILYFGRMRHTEHNTPLH